MNIEGLDYNTQREKIVLSEYGREVQKMVDYAVAIKDRAERQRCAETIILIMDRMFPQFKSAEDHDRKLWEQLAIMSGFQLDINYPFDVAQAAQIAKRPAPMSYPKSKNPVRHYGAMVFELFDKLKKMPPGEERDELVWLTANQMRRNLIQWSHSSSDEEKVATDLARYTNGKIQLDLNTFKFERERNNKVRNSNGGGRNYNNKRRK